MHGASKQKESGVSLIDIINKKKAASATQEEPRSLAQKQEEDGAKGVNPPPVEKTPEAEELAKGEEKTALDGAKPIWLKRLAAGQKPRTEDEAAWRKTVVLDTAELPLPKEAPLPKEQKVSHGGFYLFVDAVPSKLTNGHTLVQLEDLLRPFKESIQEEAKVPHWNLVQYRQGEAMLATLLEQHLKAQAPTGILLADSRSDEWKACGTILSEHADLVVRGL